MTEEVLVSYQLSKRNSLHKHNWLKYKEGFSADLVNILLDEMGIVSGDTVMDPFIGLGTTALACQMRGINSIGYDIMQISRVSVIAKGNIMRYIIVELDQPFIEFLKLELPNNYSGRTAYITITNTAYPEYNEQFIQYATEWINNSSYSEEAKNLFSLCVINSLERCSYTIKSGQYLSWDSRSKKVIEANKERLVTGRRLLPENCCRKEVCNIKDTVVEELQYAELYRVCKEGAMVAFVNDNVRYGGEVIPVDYLSTSFAEQFGFRPMKVYCLKQQKGNSSQHMAKYGRVPLRKSITIWQK